MTREPQPAEASPWAVLGLATEATAEEIRAAYLRAVKAHPPDREPSRRQNRLPQESQREFFLTYLGV